MIDEHSSIDDLVYHLVATDSKKNLIIADKLNELNSQVKRLEKDQDQEGKDDHAKDGTSTYEINTELVLSTAHITVDDDAWLDKHLGDGLVGDTFDYGYRVLIGEDWEPEGLAAEISPAFLHLLLLAQSLGCKWLVLDSDGPMVDDLKTYDW